MELEHDLCFMQDYLNKSIKGRIIINKNNTIIELERKGKNEWKFKGIMELSKGVVKDEQMIDRQIDECKED